MISYNSSDVIQCLRQYEMFANSLKLIKTNEEKKMIVKQLTKLENKIIALTNEIYEEEYYALANKECGLFDEEKERVTKLIDLIEQRLSYIEKRCNDHYHLTGETIDVTEVLGANELDKLENRVKIIDKYINNTKLEKELDNDIKSLNNKISLASEKIDINKSLNVELESTFKKAISDAYDKLGFYDLVDHKGDIEYAYYETEKSLTLAELNFETAKTSPINVLADCEAMLTDVKKDYAKYKEQMSILKLLDVFDRDVENYDDLLAKRKEVNEIIKYIKNQDFLNLVMPTITKQYNTIMMEQQDVNTFNDLVLEKERKAGALEEIKEENNSEEFQSVLKVLIENERKKQEKILDEQRRIEEEEKKRRLEIERKRQEEILKRQKIIEETRKKEMEKRTKQMLEEQQKSVLQPKKIEKNVTFETIKDEVKDEHLPSRSETFREIKEDTVFESNNDVNEIFPSEITEETVNVSPKNKDDIEKELFDEFNNNESSNINNDTNDNKFPDMSIDEYMRNFDENKLGTVDNLFENDIFPSIPM